MPADVRNRKRNRNADYNAGLIFDTPKQTKSRLQKCTTFLKVSFGVTVVLLTYAYFASPISPVQVTDLKPRVEFEGQFQPNNALHKAKRILEDRGFVGPECIVLDEEENLYTGVEDGRIFKVAKSEDGEVGEGKVEELQLGVLSDNCVKERPLGMRFFHGFLYVADAYCGIYVVNVKTHNRKILVDIKELKPVPLVTNDFDVSNDGTKVFFTTSSSELDMDTPLMENLEGRCTGSVVEYDTITGEMAVFKDGLCFANGIQLSADNRVLLVAETSRYRITEFNVHTKEMIKTIDLPMLPDNIRASSDGGYWVGLVGPRETINDVLTDHPFLRRMTAGLLGERGLSALLHYAKLSTGLVHLNAKGEVTKFLMDPDSTVASTIAHAVEDAEGNLYIGSYQAPFIVKLLKQNY